MEFTVISVYIKVLEGKLPEQIYIVSSGTTHTLNISDASATAKSFNNGNPNKPSTLNILF